MDTAVNLQSDTYTHFFNPFFIMPKSVSSKKTKAKLSPVSPASPPSAKKVKAKKPKTLSIKYGERIEHLLTGPKRTGFKHLRGNVRRNFNIAPRAATAIDGIMTLFADYLLDSIDHFRREATPKRESVLVKDVLAAARPCRGEEMAEFARDSVARYNDSFPAEQ